MLSIVTDPNTDYIFVTDFNVLAEHLDNVINQVCRPEPPTTPTLPYCDPDVTDTTQAPEGTRGVQKVLNLTYETTTYINENLSVRLSVRPSVKRVLCDKMEERSVQTFISYERPHVPEILD